MRTRMVFQLQWSVHACLKIDDVSRRSVMPEVIPGRRRIAGA
jgi:hypothetical protein